MNNKNFNKDFFFKQLVRNSDFYGHFFGYDISKQKFKIPESTAGVDRFNLICPEISNDAYLAMMRIHFSDESRTKFPVVINMPYKTFADAIPTAAIRPDREYLVGMEGIEPELLGVQTPDEKPCLTVREALVDIFMYLHSHGTLPLFNGIVVLAETDKFGFPICMIGDSRSLHFTSFERVEAEGPYGLKPVQLILP